MTWRAQDIRGLIVPLPTLFHSTGSTHHGMLREMVAYYVDAGIHGLFILGSYGQGPALGEQERMDVAETVLTAVDGRIPVVVHVGSVEPYQSTRLAVHARDHGAAAVAAIAPYYYSDRSLPELILHFEMIDAAAGLPMLLYNNPKYQGYSLTLSAIESIVEAVPNIFGAKVAKGGVDEAIAYVNAMPEFRPFTLVSTLLPGMLLGVAGTISPPMAVMPQLGVELVRAIDEQRYGDAMALQVLAAEFSSELMALGKIGGRAVQGEALRLRGFVGNFPRWPTPPVPDDTRRAIAELLESADSRLGALRNGPEAPASALVS